MKHLTETNDNDKPASVYLDKVSKQPSLLCFRLHQAWPSYAQQGYPNS